MSTTLTRTYETTCPPRLQLKAKSEVIHDGTLTVKPVKVSGTSSFGAEVLGIDWSRPVPREIVQQVS